MYDTRKSSISPAEFLRSLRENLTLARLAILTGGLIVISLLLSWPLANNSSDRYSPWPNSQSGFTRPENDQTLGTAAPSITGDALPVAQFDMIVDDGLYTDDRQALADDLKQALDYVTKRFGSPPSSRFNAMVARDASCGLHGVAYTEERTVQVSSCNDIARPRAVAIMAHEFVHQLAQDRYGPAHLSADLMLAEGVATWGAGKYWLGSQPDFRSYVRGQRDSGIFYALATDYTGKGIDAMNALYYQWASFVDFLIASYGREKFDHLYVTGHGTPGSADYRGVYDKDLGALEQEWQAWLDQ